MKIEGLPGQYEFYSDFTHDLSIAMIGPMGVGKSRAFVTKDFLLHLYNFKATKIPMTSLMVEPTYGEIDDILIPAYEQIIREEYGVPIRVGSRRGRPFIAWPWGAESKLRSAEKPERLVGTNVSHVGFDEPGQMKYDAWKKGVSRCRDPRAICRQKFANGTPEGLQHWFAKLFDKPGPGYRKILAKYWHESLVWYPDHLRETFKHDPGQLSAYLDALFVPMFGGRVYTAYDGTQLRENLPIDPHLRLLLACDFNVDHMRWHLCQLHKKEFRVLRPIEMGSNATTDQTMSVLLETYGSELKKCGVMVCGDAAGKARSTSGEVDYDIIRRRLKQAEIEYALTVPDSNPLQKNRALNVNLLLSGYEGWKMLIDDRCEDLAADFEGVIWANSQPPTIEKKDKDRTHSSDGVGYAAYKVARCYVQRSSQVSVGKPGSVRVGESMSHSTQVIGRKW